MADARDRELRSNSRPSHLYGYDVITRQRSTQVNSDGRGDGRRQVVDVSLQHSEYVLVPPASVRARGHVVSRLGYRQHISLKYICV